MDIEDSHPLRKEAFVEDIWPCLKVCRVCLKKRKPDYKAALKLCLRLEMELKTTKSVRVQEWLDSVESERGDGDDDDDETQIIRENPFLKLGYGVNAHLDVLLQLSFMFLVITVASLPIFYHYYNNNSRMLD